MAAAIFLKGLTVQMLVRRVFRVMRGNAAVVHSAAGGVGWEVLARIGAALRGALQAHGFQATSVAGPLAAAAAVPHLSEMDARRTNG